MKQSDQYHVGIVVDDIEAAKADLSAALGIEWGDLVTSPSIVIMGGETKEVTSTFCYSLSEPRLELLPTTPGTPWQPVPGAGAHHLGYWSDDVPADGAALEALGYTPEIVGPGEDGVAMWGYWTKPGSPRIELVTSAVRPMLEEYMRTGKAPY
jgi:hypothetical protein